MQDTSTDYEELTNSIQAGYFIKHGIANNNEDLFYMSVFITVSAKSYDELMWRKQQMTDMLKSMDMYISDCRFQQEAALRCVMPFLYIRSWRRWPGLKSQVNSKLQSQFPRLTRKLPWKASLQEKTGRIRRIQTPYPRLKRI